MCCGRPSTASLPGWPCRVRAARALLRAQEVADYVFVMCSELRGARMCASGNLLVREGAEQMASCLEQLSGHAGRCRGGEMRKPVLAHPGTGAGAQRSYELRIDIAAAAAAAAAVAVPSQRTPASATAGAAAPADGATGDAQARLPPVCLRF